MIRLSNWCLWDPPFAFLYMSACRSNTLANAVVIVVRLFLFCRTLVGKWQEYFQGVDPKALTKSAVVFDVDETLLSNWPEMIAADFGYIPKMQTPWIVSANSTAFPQTKGFFLDLLGGSLLSFSSVAVPPSVVCLLFSWYTSVLSACFVLPTFAHFSLLMLLSLFAVCRSWFPRHHHYW